jgi:hypothetical protein
MADLTPQAQKKLEQPELAVEDQDFLLGYLEQFGYIPVNGMTTEETFTESVQSLQRLLGLPDDGLPDARTVRALRFTPRCGMPDVMRLEIAEAISRWGRNNLTYAVVGFVPGLPPETQRRLLRAAWNSWEAVADLHLEEEDSREANIIIDVGRGRGANFDGPQGTLAWAYLPNGSDRQLLMKFDLDETWSDDPQQRGILMQNVACHEFGHLLGLDHSRARRALMAPFYAADIPSPQKVDDIPRIVSLYGPAKTPTPTPVPPVAGPVDFTASDLTEGGRAKLRALLNGASGLSIRL